MTFEKKSSIGFMLMNLGTVKYYFRGCVRKEDFEWV